MKNFATIGLGLLVICAESQAGGLERTDQSVGVIFEKGRHLELGVTKVMPDVSGVGSAQTPTPGVKTGNISKDYDSVRFAYKSDINSKMSYAIIYDQPFGSDVQYPTSTYFATGARADVNIQALTGILRYKIAEPGSVLGGQFSLLGGPRLQFVEASAKVPFVAGYSVTSESKYAAGYLAGFAWERPELGMRVSLSYNSEVKSKLKTYETLGPQTTATETDIDTPQSINLEAQTGLNSKTLLYGSVRWVPWSDFTVAPPVYTATTKGPLAYFKDDRTTYRLGLGRKITDDFTVFGELGYEESTGSGTTNLTPVDGFKSITLGASYLHNKVKYALAARYAQAGDAGTILGTVYPAGEFKDNSVVGIAFRVSFALD